MVPPMMPNSLAHQKDAELTPNAPTQFTQTVSDSKDDLQASNPWSASRCLKRRCAALTSAETAKGTFCWAPGLPDCECHFSRSGDGHAIQELNMVVDYDPVGRIMNGPYGAVGFGYRPHEGDPQAIARVLFTQCTNGAGVHAPQLLFLPKLVQELL